ncbi:hypothetical protein DSECCO2_160020 [anaerobic digester metagenome]
MCKYRNPMKRKPIIAASIVSIAMLLACTSTFGQQSDTAPDSLRASSMISFVPQYLINNGIRVDYDVRLSGNKWLQLAPQFYLREEGSDAITQNDEDYYNLIGTGLHVYYKNIPNIDFKRTNAYISYGVAWQLFRLEHNERVNDFVTPCNTTINKVGAEVTVGLLTTLGQNIGIDFYAGLGFRHSFYTTNANSISRFKGGYLDYGYTGNIILLGVRLSFIKQKPITHKE